MLSAYPLKEVSHPHSFTPHKASKPSHPFSPSREHRSNDVSNTLGALTKKFVRLIREAPQQVIEIDEASELLGIQKRRIYDITNVLEGIGYIEKLGKNKMKWVGGESGR